VPARLMLSFNCVCALWLFRTLTSKHDSQAALERSGRLLVHYDLEHNGTCSTLVVSRLN
jgi:hypothetical protein